MNVFVFSMLALVLSCSAFAQSWSCSDIQRIVKSEGKGFYLDATGERMSARHVFRTFYSRYTESDIIRIEQLRAALVLAGNEDVTPEELQSLDVYDLVELAEQPFYGTVMMNGIPVDFMNIAQGDTPYIFFFDHQTVDYTGVHSIDGDGIEIDGEGYCDVRFYEEE